MPVSVYTELREPGYQQRPGLLRAVLDSVPERATRPGVGAAAGAAVLLCWSENLPSKGSLSRTGQGSTSPRRWEHATNAAAVAVDADAAAPAAEAAAEAAKMPLYNTIYSCTP